MSIRIDITDRINERKSRKQTSSEKLQNLEPVVKNYQDTGDDRFFDHIMNQYRGYIQARAYTASKLYGLDPSDCESVLTVTLWKAVKEYDPSRERTFDAYVNTMFGYSLTSFFTKQDRDNHFFGPRTRGEGFHDDPDSPKSITMNYDMFSDGEFDLVDLRQDVENLVCDEDAAKSLLDALIVYDSVSANVAALVATGKTQLEVAKIMGYIPDVTSPKTAQNNWVKRRLEKCIKPVEKHYQQMKMPIPITFRK